MNEHKAWSVSLGRWACLQVRLHAFFLGSAVFTLYLGWLYAERQHDNALFWLAVAGMAMLFVSVLLHELGHVLAAHHLGGRAETIVIGPFGGLAPVEMPWDPKEQLVVSLAGPIVNLLICLLLSPVVIMACGTSPLALLHPLNPVPMTDAQPWQVAIMLGFWVNWLLLLVNMIPAFPFDGARAMVAAAMSISENVSQQRATATVIALAKIGALLLVVLACFAFSAGNSSVVPTWLALLLLAIFLFFSAKQHEILDQYEDEEEEKELFGYDFSQGYASLESSTSQQQQPAPPAQGALSRWLQNRRKKRERRQQQLEIEEDARLDAILARLHEHGMEGLTAEERALLKRASERYRSRLS